MIYISEQWILCLIKWYYILLHFLASFHCFSFFFFVCLYCLLILFVIHTVCFSRMFVVLFPRLVDFKIYLWVCFCLFVFVVDSNDEAYFSFYWCITIRLIILDDGNKNGIWRKTYGINYINIHLERFSNWIFSISKLSNDVFFSKPLMTGDKIAWELLYESSRQSHYVGR